jgi:enterochelin esterase family protein
VSCYIYTPPGYDNSKQSYPVLYLLHGSIERESTWTRFGYADRIMDNLIAAGAAREMIVVMPDTGTPDATDQPLDLVVQYMLEEVIPLVEQKYRVDPAQASRYVAGVAAGSNRARELAFLHPEMFAAVGIWAGGGLGSAAAPLEVSYPKLKDAAAFNSLVRFIYLALGEEDNHTAGVKNNLQRLKDSLDKLAIPSTFYLATGGHTWFNFRRFLAEFVKGL